MSDGCTGSGRPRAESVSILGVGFANVTKPAERCADAMPARIHVAMKASHSPVFVPYRMAAECGVLVVLCSWALTMYTWYGLLGPSCSPPHAAAGVGRAPVAIVSASTGLSWSVDERGFVYMSDREGDEATGPPSRQAFHLEWQVADGTNSSGRHFCLRYLRDMRLVEAVGQGHPDAFMLRLGARYSCVDPASFFTLRGRSLYSLGVGSYVNYRDHWHVRAHGDKGPPWTPLLDETVRTYVSIDPLPDRRDYVERRLLELVRKLEEQATTAKRTAPV